MNTMLEKYIVFLLLLFVFLTAIWLSQGQLRVIVDGTASLTPVNHCVLHFRLEGYREPCYEVGSLSPAKRLVGFEPGTFRFLLQRLNPLGHFSVVF